MFTFSRISTMVATSSHLFEIPCNFITINEIIARHASVNNIDGDGTVKRPSVEQLRFRLRLMMASFLWPEKNNERLGNLHEADEQLADERTRCARPIFTIALVLQSLRFAIFLQSI